MDLISGKSERRRIHFPVLKKERKTHRSLSSLFFPSFNQKRKARHNLCLYIYVCVCFVQIMVVSLHPTSSLGALSPTDSGCLPPAQSSFQQKIVEMVTQHNLFPFCLAPYTQAGFGGCLHIRMGLVVNLSTRRTDGQWCPISCPLCEI